ncbi:polysaccharide deacetylase [Rhizobiales bacterium]|uniref:polysaccharide deacetylase family protein n=1 Tax=Hongsoonwoonella zoysiae TaxID=2821844 RepID=UPI0015605BAF|nr:polysaccharide deacetylase [Hongsoonwoonella zoysiae]NRG17226.1 polysaccharide deacetylase [Hongsoonwoonella zoysiae]
MSKTHIVCITFDHDNMSPYISRDLATPTMISRGDFGVVALPRILDLLDRFDVKSTFFTPGHTIETYPACAEKVLKADHEIAHHGWTHRIPATLGKDGEEEELVRGIATIERLTGRKPRGYRSPSWDLSEHSVDLLLKHGFRYDSSMMGHDYDCYFCRKPDQLPLEQPAIFGEETPLVEMPISWTLDDFPHFEYMRNFPGIQPGLMNASLVLENFVDDFLYMKQIQDWGILTYTFHPHVIGRGHRMIMLERLLARLAEEGAVFMTMEAALDAWQAHRAGTLAEAAAR